jgi:hypothetical protein
LTIMFQLKCSTTSSWRHTSPSAVTDWGYTPFSYHKQPISMCMCMNVHPSVCACVWVCVLPEVITLRFKKSFSIPSLSPELAVPMYVCKGCCHAPDPVSLSKWLHATIPPSVWAVKTSATTPCTHMQHITTHVLAHVHSHARTCAHAHSHMHTTTDWVHTQRT